MDSTVKKKELADKILQMIRQEIMLQAGFLNPAIHQLVCIPVENGTDYASDESRNSYTFGTEGRFLHYEPDFILNEYRNSESRLTGKYLHLVLHCVMRHVFQGGEVNERYWNLACDMAVESMILGLKLPVTTTPETAKKEAVLKVMKTKTGMLTAEKLYQHFMETRMSMKEIGDLESLFHADDHSEWFCYRVKDIYRQNIRNKHKTDGSSETDKSLDSDDRKKKSSEAEKSENSQENQQDTFKKLSPEEQEQCKELSPEEIEELTALDKIKITYYEEEPEEIQKQVDELCKLWEGIAMQLSFNQKVFEARGSQEGGSMVQKVMALKREKYSYSSFLRQFAVLGEAMGTNPDEFDYIYYTYGLKKYKNMPLIESLEYYEKKGIQDLVIAIDTSGSVRGDLVQAFVQKTFNILSQEENFFRKVNVHIIQCDARIQEDVKITSPEEFAVYLQRMEIHGLGGTDFRPLFEYVEDRIEENEFHKLKGLIYLTDGRGAFPEKAPGFKAAFIYIDDGNVPPPVPEWADRLILQMEEIEEGFIS